MNTSTGTSLSVLNSAAEDFILQRPPVSIPLITISIKYSYFSYAYRAKKQALSGLVIWEGRQRLSLGHASYNNLPRPPRLAYDTSSQAFPTIMPRTPPPSRQVFNRPDYGPPQNYSQYRNEINTTYRGGSSPSRGSRTTSFGSNTSGSSRMSIGSQQVPSSFYNERIEKTTSFDDEDSAGEETMSCNSPMFDEYDNPFAIDSNLVQEVYLLRKEIDAVKNSLAGLQKNRVDTLNEKKQLEQQYQEAKSEVTRTLETSLNDSFSCNELLNTDVQKLSLELSAGNSDINLDITSEDNNNELSPEYENIMNDCVHLAKELELSKSQLEKSKSDFRDLLTVKEKIEISFETQEREYRARIRHQQSNESDSHHKGHHKGHRSQSSRSSISSFLAQQRQQSGMSSITPRDTRGHSRSHSKQKSISGSTTINATGSAGSTGSGSCLDGEKRKSGQLTDITRSINQMEHYHSSELMPSYCLSPPRVYFKL
ncbi:1313_t:CDS:2 [Racocetra fulgida]|uniref:1313_t:CDS:1 n=1 Tax=Racocetra fulgida TaxID=60492 RepID=A0A9N9F1P4_9GLOM|nr:1313_t:CDS:2 [Racocetra fulgida]